MKKSLSGGDVGEDWWMMPMVFVLLGLTFYKLILRIDWTSYENQFAILDYLKRENVN